MARPKNIDSKEDLENLFFLYIKEVKDNPILVKDWVGKDADQVYKEKEKPLTIDGFECWLFENKIINDLGDYLRNKDGRYSEFATICSYIKKRVRKDQIEGGMVGIYNPSITQRLNNLKEETDVTSGGKPIQTGLQKIEVEITRPNEDKSNTSI